MKEKIKCIPVLHMENYGVLETGRTCCLQEVFSGVEWNGKVNMDNVDDV